MKPKWKLNRERVLAARAKKRAAAKAAAAAASIGPHKLPQLEYDIYLLFEPGPRPADPEAIRAELRSAAVSSEDPEQDPPGGTPSPPASLAEVEAAVASLERQCYIERMPGADAGELWRLTPWGLAALDALRFKLKGRLLFWERDGRTRGESRPTRSTVVPDLAPWEIGPSFDELDPGYLDLSTRAQNALRRARILRVGQLTALTAKELGELRHVGQTTVAEIEARLARVGLELARPAPPAGHAGGGGDQEEEIDPCWLGKPYQYQVFSRSRWFSDQTAENHQERALWKGPLMRLAGALDQLQGTAETVPKEARPLRFAFDTLIVLVEPLWWLRHSPGEFNRADDRRWVGLLGEHELPERQGEAFLRAVEAGPEATWRSLEGIVTAAAETFVRVRDVEGLWRCGWLMRVVSEGR